jgi:hypothetical protein
MPLSGDAPLSLLLPEVGELVSLSVLNTNYETINTYSETTDLRLDAAESLVASQTVLLDNFTILNGTQDGRLTANESRLNGIDTLNGTQNTRLTTIESYSLNSRVGAVESAATSLDARLDNLELDIDGGTP